jgi:hypothetical protein
MFKIPFIRLIIILFIKEYYLNPFYFPFITRLKTINFDYKL